MSEVTDAAPDTSMTGGATSPDQPAAAEPSNPLNAAADAMYTFDDADTSSEETQSDTEGDTEETGASAITGGDEDGSESEETVSADAASEDGEASEDGTGDEASDTGDFVAELPEGFEWTEDRKSRFTEFASKLKLDAEGQQAAVNLHAELVRDDMQAAEDEFKNLRAEWRKEIRAYPELGGENLQESNQKVAAFMDMFGDGELRKALDETGFGDNPHLWAAIARAGEHVLQGAFKFSTAGSHVGGRPASRGEAAALIYDKSPELNSN